MGPQASNELYRLLIEEQDVSMAHGQMTDIRKSLLIQFPFRMHTMISVKWKTCSDA